MLDLRLIRTSPDAVRAGLARRGAAEHLDAIIDLDRDARQIRTQVEEARAERGRLSKAIGMGKRDGADTSADEALARELGDRLSDLEARLADLETRRDDLLIELPNLPEEETPDGGEDDAVELRRVGRPATLDPVRDHVEIAEAMGGLDFDQAAKISGARFAYLIGPIARLQFALISFVVDRVEREGFTPVVPPVMVREEAMYGTGFFPTDRASIYALADDDLFLVGTSEVPLAGLGLDRIFSDDELPLRVAGVSSCFRREAGAAGRDTRGIFRMHQFDKVEMFSFVDAEDSRDEHRRILAVEEGILGDLGIPYRVVDIALGDLGAPAARKFDCEAWIPSQERYREVTSCSNCTDYQARRLRARVKGSGGTRLVHTLNGTAVAVGRTIIALLENHQQPDGTVAVPSVLVEHGAPAVLGASSGGASDRPG
ncbi:MAG: serine--tRNA ligase [Actinobacteria bacterium]|nr:serine--tRNA ligase [Thermoleophilia bacterium]MCB9011955.1 serine--tRNA ligase [Actinomycetota bacterium]